jgi:hypothetical protein
MTLLRHVETNLQTDDTIGEWQHPVIEWDWREAVVTADLEQDEKRKARGRKMKERKARKQLGKDAGKKNALSFGLVREI